MDQELRGALEAVLNENVDSNAGTRPFSMVIRGGVSLGVYEAGVNWAVLRLLKDLSLDADRSIDPELYAAAGASAGAVNGFLAGMLWCTEERAGEPRDTLDSNVFRDSWLSIDINRLLDRQAAIGGNTEALNDPAARFARRPGETAEERARRLRNEAAEDSGLLSRAALRDVIDQINREIDGDVDAGVEKRTFRAGCSVGFGVSLTRENPVLFTNAGVDIAQQRLLLPLRMVGTDEGGLEIRHFPREEIGTPTFSPSRPISRDELERRSFLSSIIYLDDLVAKDIEQDPVSRDSVFDVVKASSAFPVAFSPMKLSYCLYQSEPLQARTAALKAENDEISNRCPDEYRRLSSRFVDGGVFDNDPMELVRNLSELQSAASDPPVRYVKIDPDKRRAARNEFRYSPARVAEPGDSLDLVLWTANRTPAGDIDTSGTVDILLRHCDANNQPVGDYALKLVESAPHAQLFVGTIDTRPTSGDVTDKKYPGLSAMLAEGGYRAVGAGHRLIPYHVSETAPHKPDKPYVPECAYPDAPATKGLTEEEIRVETLWLRDTETRTRNRTIGFVEKAPQGLSTQLRFLGGSVSSARGYRLYDELMRNDWRDGLTPNLPETALPLLQPTRLTGLTGDFLFAFAAFLDMRFRYFDYYAGVYDSVFGMAELTCLRGDEGYEPPQACHAARAEKIYLQLCAPSAPDVAAQVRQCRRAHPAANAVLHQLITLEQCGTDVITDPARARPCELGDWHWITKLHDTHAPDTLPAQLVATGTALQKAIALTTENGRDPFVRFIKDLARDDSGFARHRRYPLRPDEAPETVAGAAGPRVLDRMLALSERPVPTWFYPIASAGVPQMLAQEREDEAIRASVTLDAADSTGFILPALAIGGLAAESTMAERTGWLSDQTSVPRYAGNRRLVPFLPAEFAVDARSGDLALYVNPSLRSESGKVELDLRIAPWLRQRSDNETIEFSELSALMTYRPRNPLFSSVGIGPTYTYTWTDEVDARRHNLGATLSVGMLAEKIRLSYGVRSFSRPDFAGDDIFLQIGVNDVPGLVYWACQGDQDMPVLSFFCKPFR